LALARSALGKVIPGQLVSSLTVEFYCGVIQIRYQLLIFHSDAGLAAAIILGPLTILAGRLAQQLNNPKHSISAECPGYGQSMMPFLLASTSSLQQYFRHDGAIIG
jgi:hypothetical protein